MRWFKFYPDDYLAGVIDLTAEEAGAYMALLALMYQRGGAIPNDDRWICGHVRLGTRAWHRVRERLCRLGKIIVDADGTLANRRVISEIVSAKLQQEKHRNISVSGGKASAKSRAEANQINAMAEPAAQPAVNQIEKREEDIDTPVGKPTGVAKPKKPLIEFPDKFEPAPAVLAHAVSIGFSQAEIAAIVGEFCAFWAERPGERRTFGHWQITLKQKFTTVAASDTRRRELRVIVNEPPSLFDGETHDQRGFQSARRNDDRRPLSVPEIAMRLAAEAKRDGR
jgi:uncharacterized protein YdaU (DUF1376 family)